MEFDPQHGHFGVGPAAAQTPADRRSIARMKGKGIDCDLGRVVDVSMAGVHLLTKRNLEDEFDLVLSCADVEVSLRGRVKWTKPGRMFRPHEVGIEFLELSDEQQRELRTLLLGEQPRKVA